MLSAGADVLWEYVLCGGDRVLQRCGLVCEEGGPDDGVGYCDGDGAEEDGCGGESVESGRRGGGGGAAGSGSGAWGDGVLGCSVCCSR